MLQNSHHCSKLNHNKASVTASLQFNRLSMPVRQNKIFSQPQNNIQSSTKRQQTFPSQQKTHKRKGSSLLFSKNLFKEAKKVNSKDPKQSFLPIQSKLTDNKTKIKILLSAYSKLQNKSKVALSPKSSNIKRLQKTDQINNEQMKTVQNFTNLPLSSLTRLILNECKIICKQNSNQCEQMDSSLNKILKEEKYSQWINILCEYSIIPHKAQHDTHSLDDENPYQLFVPKDSKLKLRSQLPDYHFQNA